MSPTPHLLTHPTAGRLVDAAIIGGVICLAGEIGGLLYALFVAATLGLGCLLLPVYWLLIGYFKLMLASAVLPGWFTYSHNIIAVLVMSSVLGASRLHPRARSDATDGARPSAAPFQGRGGRGPHASRDPQEVQAEWREIPDPPRP